MRTSNIIPNVYNMSTSSIKCRVESHFIREKTSEHENNYLSTMNQAEKKAMKEEQIRLEEEIKKRKQIEEMNKKLEDNLKAQKIFSRAKNEEMKKLEQEKKTKAEKIKEYNKKIRVLVEKPKQLENIISNPDGLKTVQYTQETPNPASPKFNTISLKNYQTFSFTESMPKAKADNYKEEQPMLYEAKPTSEKEFNIYNNRVYVESALIKKIKKDSSENTDENINIHTNMSNRNVVNIRDRILSSIKEKIDSEVSSPNEEYISTQKHNNCYHSNIQDLNNELRKNVENVKEFRKNGAITINSNNHPANNINEDKIYDETARNDEKKASEIEEKYLKQNELEKRRYTKALKNIMIEKFKEKSVVIPNICSCGQLQKKLDTIIENKNVSVYSVVNVECANNCIYYNNTNEYHKAISDIIHSVKNLKFESFHS